MGIFRAGVTPGGYLTQRLLIMGGPYGYLGAAAVAGGTLTLDMMTPNAEGLRLLMCCMIISAVWH